ncbi:hypothetical protein WJX82_007778 [Trebouxia sp. C0006]
MPSQEHISEQLKVLLSEDLKVISYKWLARKFGLPCNLAKQTLFAFLEQHRGKVKATYLLAGWTKTDPRQHTVQLVDSEHLSTRRSALDPVTSMHVYSLQPTQPKDASELWNHDAIQTSELFQQLRLGQTNCLADNRWSAVKCIEAKHDPSLAKRAPKPAAAPSTDAAAPSKPAQKAAPNSAAGQIAGIMAGSAKQGGVATASVAVKGSGSSSIQDSAEAQPLERHSGTTAIAPSGAAPLSGPASGGPSTASAPGGGGGGKKKGGKSRLANMWSKAPAVKEKPQQAARSKAQAAPAVDADAALRSAQQAGSSSDSEEEEMLPMKRPAQQRSKRIEEEEEDEEDDLLVKPAGRQAKKARTSGSDKTAMPAKARQAAIEESEDDEEEAPAQAAGSPVKIEVAKPKGKATAANKKKTAAAAKKPPVKKGPAKKPAAKQIQSDEEMSDGDIEVSVGDEEQQHETQGEPDLTQGEEGGASQAGKGRKGTKRAAANKPGTVKTGSAAAGPKRRKVMRTAINDRGEEVTEEIWEDNQDASTPEEQDEQADGKQPEESAARSPVSKSPEKASQDDALKEQPGKPAAAKPNKPSGPAAKRGSSKIAAKDQRGIMSFFAKK